MNKAVLRPLALCLLSALVVVGVGCDSANPVAPSGTILTISASPTQIGLNGESVITVIGRRPDGNPIHPGTEVRFSSTLGIIDAIVEADERGIAVARLRADGRSGTATVEASTGVGGGEGGGAVATTDVVIGESDDTRPQLLVSANPDNIPVQGESVITVIARRPDGTPLGAGFEVILTTTLGTLVPSRPVTGADGVATSNLLAGDQAGTATVTAILGASAPVETQVTIREAATDISVQANPQTVAPSGGTVELSAFVTDSQGQPLQGAPVTFNSQRGTLASTDVQFTNTNGLATNTLTVTEQQLQGVASFEVQASTPSGTGDLITDTTTIRVQGQ